MNVDVVPIGGAVLPEDLVAPFECCGEVFVASIEEVALAAAGVDPVVCPLCELRFGVKRIELVSFFSRAEWDRAPDEDPPPVYHVGHAFVLPGLQP